MVRIETFPLNIIDNFYKAFAKIAPVRVLMKIPRKEDLPEGLPDNVLVLPWMPQLKILRESQIIKNDFYVHPKKNYTLYIIAFYYIPKLNLKIKNSYFLFVRCY